MKEVKAIFPIFLLLLIISFIILFFLQTPVSGIFQFITLPLQRVVFMSNVQSSSSLTSSQYLQQENNELHSELAQMQEVQQDNQALHDQFATSNPSSQKLLPAHVIGVQQNALFIDKGENDNVHIGEVVVVKNNLIGTITRITPHISQVMLLNDPSTSLTAQDIKTSAVGIVSSIDGGVIVFGNVELTDKLSQNDLVVTKGSQNLQGQGYPPGLVVGKIVSVDKQASSLFQAGKLTSLVDFSHLTMVFVMTH